MKINLQVFFVVGRSFIFGVNKNGKLGYGKDRYTGMINRVKFKNREYDVRDLKFSIEFRADVGGVTCPS